MKERTNFFEIMKKEIEEMLSKILILFLPFFKPNES